MSINDSQETQVHHDRGSDACEVLENEVYQILQGLSLNDQGPDIVRSGEIYAVVATGSVLRVLLDPDKLDNEQQELLAEAIEPLLTSLPGVGRVVVKPRPQSHAQHQHLPGIGKIIAIHSGKGGVGKSSIAASLAMALSAQGQRTGLLDADLYGPSAGRLFGLHGRASEQDASEQDASDKIAPFQAHGVKLMSLAFLVPEDQALAWRGTLVSEGLPQLIRDVDWGELDYLIIDLPPGTSDIHLALCGYVQIDGVITVTTPGETSLDDVRRGMEMFADLAVPSLGLVENMAGFECRQCGHSLPLFGQSGGERLSEELGMPLLGSIPFEPKVVAHSEGGESLLDELPDSMLAQTVQRLAKTLITEFDRAAERGDEQ